jgi:hypothetical protein
MNPYPRVRVKIPALAARNLMIGSEIAKGLTFTQSRCHRMLKMTQGFSSALSLARLWI